MCAEKDQAFCHRSLLVGYHLLHNKKLEIQHIGFDGALESQSALEQRLVSIHGLDQDLFAAPEELAQLAYQRQLKNTSYRKPS